MQQVGPEPKAGEGRIRRSFVSPDHLITSPDPGKVTVLAHILDHAKTEFADVQGLGWRDVIDVVKENKEVTKVRGVTIGSGNRDRLPQPQRFWTVSSAWPVPPDP